MLAVAARLFLRTVKLLKSRSKTLLLLALLLAALFVLGGICFAEGEEPALEAGDQAESEPNADSVLPVVDEYLIYQVQLLQGVLMSCTGLLVGYLSIGEVLRCIW